MKARIGLMKVTHIGEYPNSEILVFVYGVGSRFEGNAPEFDWTEESAGGGHTSLTISRCIDKRYLNNSRWLRDSNQRCQ